MAHVIDSFRDPAKGITIQPADSEIPFRFEFPAASSQAANDGAIPHGTTIAIATVVGLDANGDEADGLAGVRVVEDEAITIPLSWPTAGAGTYKLSFALTLNTGAVIEYDFNRITAKDL
jgi:hypothetical protein